MNIIRLSAAILTVCIIAAAACGCSPTPEVSSAESYIGDVSSVVSETASAPESSDTVSNVSEEQKTEEITVPGRTVCIATATVSKNDDGYITELMLDKGKNDGIKVGCMVVTNDGYVGMVKSAGSSSSKVATLLSSDINIVAEAEGRSKRCFLTGDADAAKRGYCIIKEISSGIDAMPGDIVYTVEMVGAALPGGIAVGMVTEVYGDDSGMARYATVRPAVKLDGALTVGVVVG